ncbi:hypothetical protein D9M72_611080 [compost metagenome]
MHGGHLVEEFRLDDLQPRLEQLGADHHGERAAEEEGGEAEPQVHRADVLVVGGQDPAHQTFGRAMAVMVVDGVRMLGVLDHCSHHRLLIVVSA